MKNLKLLSAAILLALSLTVNATTTHDYERRNNDILTLADVVYFEARGEPRIGQIAVAYVVINRIESEKFAHTVQHVVNQPNQFSYKSDKIKDVITDKDAYNEAIQIASLVIDKKVPDPTRGAIYYKNDKVSKQVWKKRLIYKVGSHSFYV